jgi:hypothetical protein
MKQWLIIFIIISLCINTRAQTGSAPIGDHAHPVNLKQTKVTTNGGILRFEYKWDSSTGDPNDLNRVWVGEHVTYPRNGITRQPPWKGNFVNPTISPSRDANNGPDGGVVDSHYPPGTITWLQPPLCAWPEGWRTRDTVTSTQNYGYHCRICDSTPPDDSLGWQTSLIPAITITRYVEITGMGWRYRITKSGSTAIVQLN